MHLMRCRCSMEFNMSYLASAVFKHFWTTSGASRDSALSLVMSSNKLFKQTALQNVLLAMVFSRPSGDNFVPNCCGVDWRRASELTHTFCVAGGQEKVWQKDSQILSEPGTYAFTFNKETRKCVPRGRYISLKNVDIWQESERGLSRCVLLFTGRRGHGYGRARLLPGVAGVRVPAAGGAGTQEVWVGGDAAGLRVRLVDLPPHRARRARRRRAARARPAAQDTAGNQPFTTLHWLECLDCCDTSTWTRII